MEAEKCEFHSPSVSFIGFIVSMGTVSKDPEKVHAVKEWPTPTSKKQLQRLFRFLSKRSEREDRMHPCAFLSKKLTSAERNYDIGNRSYSTSRLHWRNGDIGWRGWSSPFWYRQITGTWNICKRQNTSTLNRPGLIF